MTGSFLLEGLKVVDFTGAIAGPLATRYLAAAGATVVKVESHKYPDSVRQVVPYKDDIPDIDRSTQFAFYNFSKYSISLDMDKPLGLDAAKRLIKWADVVIENKSPGVMAKWGLDYERCRQLKPDIIYLSSSSLGRSGPLSNYAAWGYHHGPLAGFSHLIGWPDRLPCSDSIAYTDSLAPAFSVIALVGALLYRRRTGKGVFIDQSQMESGIYFLGPTVLDSLVNDRVASRQGNRDPYMVPHGLFPCLGDDKWVAITVAGEEEWRQLCRALGREEWLKDGRFATVVARKRNEDELERLIGEWTRQRTAKEGMELLQAAGVPAGMVVVGEDILSDPQLKHREHFDTLEHKLVGHYTYERPPFRLAKVLHHQQRPAPLLGEHNEYVCKEVLGMSDEEIAELVIQGVFD